MFKFARLHQLRAVTPYLPRGECRLDPHIYEMVLFEFLKTDSPVSKSLRSLCSLSGFFNTSLCGFQKIVALFFTLEFSKWVFNFFW